MRVTLEYGLTPNEEAAVRFLYPNTSTEAAVRARLDLHMNEFVANCLTLHSQHKKLQREGLN